MLRQCYLPALIIEVKFQQISVGKFRRVNCRTKSALFKKILTPVRSYIKILGVLLSSVNSLHHHHCDDCMSHTGMSIGQNLSASLQYTSRGTKSGFLSHGVFVVTAVPTVMTKQLRV